MKKSTELETTGIGLKMIVKEAQSFMDSIRWISLGL